MSNFLEIALSAHAAGLCVVPPRMDGSKAPLPRTWKTFQQARPDPDQLRRWYSDGLTGIGAIPGAVSGNLEALEFDDEESYLHFKDVADEAGLGAIIARLERGYVESSPGGGRHWLYRCDEIGGNTKLATRPDGTDDHGRPRVKTLIETRGEGGFIILAPSNGKVHPTGRAYRLLGGGFDTIPALTPAERRELFALARTFHVVEPAKIRDPDPRPAGAAGERPGDAFNARALWPDVLEPHGWIRLYGRGETTYWRRPDKREGVSAATNWQGRDYLFVWSSSTPFETETPITKFAAYAALEHGGDLKRAAKALAEQGFGTQRRAAKRTNDAPPSGDGEERPAIIIERGKLSEMLVQAESALMKHCPDLYQRAGMLVRAARLPQDVHVHGLKQKAGSLNLIPVSKDFLMWLMNRHIEWQKWVKAGEGTFELKPADAPPALAAMLLDLSGHWRLPYLSAVMECPTMRRDGTVLVRNGYDSTSGLYLDGGGIEFDPIPDRPTKAQAERALDDLRDVIKDFPFEEPEDRAVTLSGILTIPIRHLMTAAPLHAFSATRPGSGKSFQADIAAMIATGRTAPAMSQAQDPTEEEKRLVGILLSGAQLALIDNINKPLESDRLCSVLTQQTYQGRVLGLNKNPHLPCRLTWFATGNALALMDDLNDRTIMGCLSPATERPEQQLFDRDLYRWIPEHRHRLASSGLTVLRSYVVHDFPTQKITPFVRFADWSRLVRSALVWLGETDPVKTQERLRGRDPVTTGLGAFLSAWRDAFKDRAASAKEAINSQSDPLWQSILEVASTDGEKVSVKSLGKYLAKYAGRAEGGLKIELKGISNGIRQWRVAPTKK